MGKPSEIRAKNTLVHEVNGTKYICLKLSGYAAMKCFGVPAVAGMIDAAGASETQIKDAAHNLSESEMTAIAAKILKECMLDPSLGDHSDDAANVTTLRDMCDDAQELFDKIVSASRMGEAKGFSNSSPAPKDKQ